MSNCWRRRPVLYEVMGSTISIPAGVPRRALFTSSVFQAPPFQSVACAVPLVVRRSRGQLGESLPGRPCFVSSVELPSLVAGVASFPKVLKTPRIYAGCSTFATVRIHCMGRIQPGLRLQDF